jgi:hypothetical protein
MNTALWRRCCLVAVVAALHVACDDDACTASREEDCAVQDLVAIFDSRPELAGCSAPDATDVSDGEIPTVTVGDDRAFSISITADVPGGALGNLRAQLIPQRTPLEPVFLPMALEGTLWTVTAGVTWPQDGEATFLVRVAGKEAIFPVNVVTFDADVTLQAAAPAGTPLVTLQAAIACAGKGVPNQQVRFQSLPVSAFLPDSGRTDAGGVFRTTLRIGMDNPLPIHVEVFGGAARAGCTIAAAGSAVTDACLPLLPPM